MAPGSVSRDPRGPRSSGAGYASGGPLTAPRPRFHCSFCGGLNGRGTPEVLPGSTLREGMQAQMSLWDQQVTQVAGEGWIHGRAQSLLKGIKSIN